MNTDSPVFAHPSHSGGHRRRLVAITLLLALIAAACGGGATSTEPLTMGPDAVFSSTSNLTDPPTIWEGKLLGLIKTETSSFNSASGTCLVVLGVTSATAGQESLTSMGMKQVVIKVGGELVFPEDNNCETQAVRDAGYDWLINMDVPPGTNFPFFEEYFIPGVDNVTPDFVLYGMDTAGLESTPFLPTILTAIPALPA